MDGGAHGLLHPPELGAHRRPLDIVRATLALQPAVPDVAFGVHGDVAFRTSVRRDADELGHGHHLVSFFFRALVGQAGRESTSAVGRAERATCAYCVGVRRRARLRSAIIPPMENALYYTLSTIAQTLAGALAILVAAVLFRLSSLSKERELAADILRNNGIDPDIYLPMARDRGYEAMAARVQEVSGLVITQTDFLRRACAAATAAYKTWDRINLRLFTALGATAGDIAACLVALPYTPSLVGSGWSTPVIWTTVGLSIICLLLYVWLIVAMVRRPSEITQ